MISALVSSRSLYRGIGGCRGVGLLYGLTYRPVLSPLLNMVIQTEITTSDYSSSKFLSLRQ